MNLTKKPDEGWDRAWRNEVTRNRNIWRGVAIAMLFLNGGESVQRAFKKPDLIKEVVPFAVDQDIGYRQMYKLDDGEVLTPSESLAKADLSRFVTARESYDYYNLNEPKTQVKSMATGSVAEDYNKIYFSNAPLQKTLGDKVRIMIKVTYVSPTGGETRTVHFAKKMIAGGKETTTYHIATVTFEYVESVELDMDEALKNPLRMQIYYYKVEADMRSSS